MVALTDMTLGIGRFARLAGVLLACSIFLLVAGCDDETTDTFAVKIGGEWFTLETAYTAEDRAQGLMHRDSIPDDGGMIFVFPDVRERSFWMKNCLVDMDIIYLDRAHRILSAYNMKAQPLQRPDETEIEYEDRIRQTADYTSQGAAQIVIELRAERIQELGLRKGQKIDLDEDRLKELIRLADDSP